MTLTGKILAAFCLLMLAGSLMACGSTLDSAPQEMDGPRQMSFREETEANGSTGLAGPAGRPAPAATAAPAPAPTATAAPAAAPTPVAAMARTVEVERESEASEDGASSPSGTGTGIVASLPAQQRIIIRTVDMQLTVSDVADRHWTRLPPWPPGRVGGWSTPTEAPGTVGLSRSECLPGPSTPP